MNILMQILAAIGIATLYAILCLAFFYAHEWLKNRNTDNYDDYQDRAG